MTDWIKILPAFAIGTAAGYVYFQMLWMTVRNIWVVQRHGFLFIASYIIRTFIALTGLYTVMGNGWFGIGGYILGFLIMRKVMVVRIKPNLASPPIQRG
jgi:F1F0 ATPase subunit 2